MTLQAAKHAPAATAVSVSTLRPFRVGLNATSFHHYPFCVEAPDMPMGLIRNAKMAEAITNVDRFPSFARRPSIPALFQPQNCPNIMHTVLNSFMENKCHTLIEAARTQKPITASNQKTAFKIFLNGFDESSIVVFNRLGTDLRM